MSLVSLQSKENRDKPFLFGTHFPQPIKLPPYSQVCVLKFLHYRNNTIYSITSSNNLLKFILGDVRYDAIRDVILTEGQYTGNALATELQLKLNATLQQFNYTFSVDFTAADPTTSPPTQDSFKITYASVPLPVSTFGGVYRNTKVDPMTNEDYDTNTEAVYSNAGINDSLNSNVSTRGIITHEGQFTFTGIAFDTESWEQSLFSTTPGFSKYSIGLVRDSLSKFDTGNSNLDFTYQHGDVGIKFDSTGFEIFSITQNNKKKLGSDGAIEYRPCRKFSSTTLDVGIADENEAMKTRYKFIITLIGAGDVASGNIQAGHKFLIQLEVSDDYGASYITAGDNLFGNDTKGDSYVKTKAIGSTNYPGLIWISDDEELNDQADDGTTLAIKNALQTKHAPFRGFIENYGSTTGNTLELDYEAATWTGGIITTYTGLFNYDWVMNVSGTDYYLRFEDPIRFQVSTTDTDILSSDGTVDLDLTSLTPLTFKWTPGINPVVDLTTTDELPAIAGPSEFTLSGLWNSAENPVSISLRKSNDDIAAHKALYDDEGTGFNLEGTASGVLVGTDLSKQCSLLLSALTEGDIVSNKGLPLKLTGTSKSGTMGQALGSLDRVKVNTTSTGQQVFISNTTPKKISKDSTLHISIPELSGVKSYEGGYNGIGKSIAQIPREEVVQNEDNGTLTYIAPFENWIDINNTQQLNLNSFTTEVRFPDGALATDLRPTTTLQIKLRTDPETMRKSEGESQMKQLTDTLRLFVQKNVGS